MNIIIKKYKEENQSLKEDKQELESENFRLQSVIDCLQQKIDKLEEFRETTCCVEWNILDVKNRAIEMHYQLVDADCIKILKKMELMHDSNIGISWDVIDYAIEYFVQNLEKEN